MKPPGELWMRWRVRAGYPVAIAFAALAQPTMLNLLVGAVVAGLGLLVRALAAGHLRKHEALATSGPYAFTRNPLYFGSAILAAGFLVAGRSWIAIAIVAAYFVVFYSAVMRREEQELRARYGVAFDDYAARVPLFWPRLTPAGSGRADFSGQLYRRNREYQAAIGTVTGLLLLYAKMRWLG
jgi:protein-S-isoprenylcysteine O-methyltransferase Ste14